MRKTISAAIIAIAATAMTLQSANAGDRGKDIAIGILGATAGFIVGSQANAAPRPVAPTPPPPGYHPHGWQQNQYHRPPMPPRPPHPVRPGKELRRAGDPWSATWLRYCRDTYRSFNPKTGTFRGFDRRDHFCVMPEHLKPRGRFD